MGRGARVVGVVVVLMVVLGACQAGKSAGRLIDEAAARHGYAIRDILRAAVDKLAREAAQDADG